MEFVENTSDSMNCTENFDGLADDMLLAVADNLDFLQAAERKKQRQANKLTSSQGFRLLEEVVGNELEYSFSLDNSFDLTQNVTTNESTISKNEKTPEHKSIVEQIFQDFCSSPVTPKTAALEERLKCKEKSPTFIFKHKSLRTYSHRKISKVSKQNNGVTAEEEEERLSISSGLSVQEDVAESKEDNKSPILNKTQKVYENLMNLSSFFSQVDEEIVPTTDLHLKKSSELSDIDLLDSHKDTQQLNADDSTHNRLNQNNTKICNSKLQILNDYSKWKM